jgi:hypothetical protein
MKLKDLHTNLEKEINLLKFRPKKEISVDSFLAPENIIKDISEKLQKSIKVKRNSEIKVKTIKKNNNFDALNNIKKDNDISLEENKKNKFKRLKTLVINLFPQNIKSTRVFSPLKKYLLLFLLFIFLIFIDKIAIEHFTNN